MPAAEFVNFGFRSKVGEFTSSFFASFFFIVGGSCQVFLLLNDNFIGSVQNTKVPT